MTNFPHYVEYAGIRMGFYLDNASKFALSDKSGNKLDMFSIDFDTLCELCEKAEYYIKCASAD